MADSGSICHFIVVGYDRDVLSYVYRTWKHFYMHLNTSWTPSTTRKKMNLIFEIYCFQTRDESQIWELETIMDICLHLITLTNSSPKFIQGVCHHYFCFTEYHLIPHFIDVSYFIGTLNFFTMWLLGLLRTNYDKTLHIFF